MQHAPISQVRYVQESRTMRFQEAYDGWSQGRLTQAKAALLLGQGERSFRRHIERFEADGLQGLLDKRLSQISKRRASGAEIDKVVQLYRLTSFATTTCAPPLGCTAMWMPPWRCFMGRAGWRPLTPRGHLTQKVRH
jgi:hypothetical protein